MKKAFSCSIAALIALCLAGPAMSHGLWVNAYHNNIHAPGHVLACIGFGHLAPLDDLLTTKHGALSLSSYILVDPNNATTELPKPKCDISTIKTKAGVDVITGELGVCKMALKKESLEGTYQVAAAGKDAFFSMWIGADGKSVSGMIPMDEIENPRKILMSMQYKSNAKTSFAVGKWTGPSKLGYDLEITPVSDLSRVKVGDVVEFEVTFMGKPLSSGVDGMFSLIGISGSFGASDKTFLMSYLENGRCAFRMPAAGQWLMQARMQEDVARRADLSALKGKCMTIHYASSYTFHVQP
ncbi:DUF4198 domain-containing protein [Desulfarculus baarsii]